MPAASITNEQASDYAAAVQSLAPFQVRLPAAASTLAECLELAGDLPTVHAAVKFYALRNRKVQHKRVAEVVAELLAVREGRGASRRHLDDLRARLNRFAGAFLKDTCNVTTAEIQAWLDGQSLHPSNYRNFRRVLHLLFEFGVARGYAIDNPVAGVESIEAKDGDVEIFTPLELGRLLAAASPEFVPCIALGAFAGLRSAEIERLEWSDIDLKSRCIVVGASQAKTATRRVVPVCDALAAWLAPYAENQGRVWTATHEGFYDEQQVAAAATEVKEDREKGVKAMKPVRWKPNALRHSYAKRGFAARWLFSTRHVDTLLAQGLPHLKIGNRRVRILLDDADAWMRERFGAQRRGNARPTVTTGGSATTTARASR